MCRVRWLLLLLLLLLLLPHWTLITSEPHGSMGVPAKGTAVPAPPRSPPRSLPRSPPQLRLVAHDLCGPGVKGRPPSDHTHPTRRAGARERERERARERERDPTLTHADSIRLHLTASP